jgi:hypothetical protein
MKTLIFTLLLIVPFLGFGQDTVELIEPFNDYLANKADENAFVPFGASSVSNPVSNLQFSSTKGESAASVGIGYQINPKWSTNVEVSSPVAKSGATKPIGLDGLANDGKFTIGLQYKGWKALTASEVMNALKPYKDDKGEQITSFQNLKDEDKDQLLDNLSELHSPWFIGGTFTLTQQEFSYATDNTLSEIVDEDKQSVSLSGYAGIYLGKKVNTLLRVVVLSKKSFGANSANDYYIPFNGGPTLLKRSLIIGKPNENSETEIKLENVTAFSKNKWGINPSFTYLAEAEAFSIDLPVYFVGGKDDDKKDLGLNTGVYINYTSSLNEPLTAGIFIGSSLTKILRPN